MFTPTGAAILKALARPAASITNFEIERIGYGAGTKTFADRPNILRLMIGRERTTFATDDMVKFPPISTTQSAVYGHLSNRPLRCRRARCYPHADHHEKGRRPSPDRPARPPRATT